MFALIILIIHRKKIRKEADRELLERELNRCKMDIRLRHQEIFEEENKKEIIEFEMYDLKTIYDLLISLSNINLKMFKTIIKVYTK